MTTTNALTFVLRDAGLKKPADYTIMPIEKGRAEMMEFSRVLDRLGTGVSTEKAESTTDYTKVKTSEVMKKTEDAETPKEEYGSKISEKIKSKETEAVNEEEVTEAAETFYEEMVSLLCTTFNVEPEELMGALEELGISMGDLLEPANMANLFVHFGKELTVADVLMSEDFQPVNAQVEELVAQLSQEFEIPADEWKGILETLEQNMNPENLVKEQVQEDVVVEMVDETEEVVVKQATLETDETTIETVTEETDDTNANKVQQQQTDLSGNTDDKENQGTQTLNETKLEFEPENRKEATFEELGGQTVSRNVITTSDGTVVQETVKVVDLQNLVSEVTEYVHLTSGNEFSKIEMQLNPANLGKMIIEVSSANGEVTTKIITQTEAGKEAIESNINQMRSNLEAQGVKVAAVEVTVESHAFEQNLQGESSNEQEQLMREHQENNKKHPLNLNLNELTLDDLAGLMSEEEMLTVRMMRDNGNKLDLTV